MTTETTKYTNASAAGDEVHARAERHMSAKGGTYAEAAHAVLASDPELARAYAQPAARRVTMATKPAEKRSQPAVPVTGGDEREILDWVLRALKDNMVGWLPGALGNLTIEADRFRKLGMPDEEAARRAMDGNPHLVSLAKLLIVDIRRNAPSMPTDEAAAAAQTPGDVLHIRAQALTDKHPHLSYSAAVHQVFDDDPALKAAYARS